MVIIINIITLSLLVKKPKLCPWLCDPFCEWMFISACVWVNVGMIVPVWESMCVICPLTELHGCGCACVSMFIWLHICGYDYTSVWAYVCIIYVHTVACLWMWEHVCDCCICSYGYIHVGHTCVLGLLFVHMASCVCMWLCVCSFVWLHIQGSLLNKSFPIILAWLVVKPRWSATLHFLVLGLQALH